MNGRKAKELRRIARETAQPHKARYGWVELGPSLKWKSNAYQLVCLGVRRMYLDLKKAYYRGADTPKRSLLKDAARLVMACSPVLIRGKYCSTKGDAKRRIKIIRRATA